jgi:hypothetical protein
MIANWFESNLSKIKFDTGMYLLEPRVPSSLKVVIIQLPFTCLNQISLWKLNTEWHKQPTEGVIMMMNIFVGYLVVQIKQF